MRKLSLTLFVFIALAWCAVHSSAQEVLDAEEYAVYSVLLSSRLAHTRAESLVIGDRTVGLADDAVMRAKLPYVGEYLRSVPKSALRDFGTKNQRSYALENRFGLPVRYNLADKNGLAALFKDGGGGWQTFYSHYPKSGGIVGLSRVGFNSDRNQALVYVASSCGMRCGQRSFILLKKEKGAWKVKGAFTPVVN